jgi:ADP-ribose pyrophosphatase YjhB (NUDIX family)
MPGLAVNVAVIHEDKILLTKREDFETWILPSGGVEASVSTSSTTKKCLTRSGSLQQLALTSEAVSKGPVHAVLAGVLFRL